MALKCHILIDIYRKKLEPISITLHLAVLPVTSSFVGDGLSLHRDGVGSILAALPDQTFDFFFFKKCFNFEYFFMLL